MFRPLANGSESKDPDQEVGEEREKRADADPKSNTRSRARKAEDEREYQDFYIALVNLDESPSHMSTTTDITCGWAWRGPGWPGPAQGHPLSARDAAGPADR